MPILASLALAAFFVHSTLTPTAADVGDAAVLNVCIGPGGVMRALAPSELCPRNHVRVRVPIGNPPAVTYYTVQRSTELVGPGTISAVTVSCEDDDKVVGGGYAHTTDEPDVQVSASAPDGHGARAVRVQNFSSTLSLQLDLYARCARLTP